MACTEPKEEWTIQTETDPQPNRQPTIQTLVFCVTVDQGIISGEVADGVAGQVLSEVTGRRDSLGALGLDEAATFMTLNFSNGASRVMLAGVTFQKNFRGRFTSFAAAQRAATGPSGGTTLAAPPAPGDGDTGTGTGTQT